MAKNDEHGPAGKGYIKTTKAGLLLRLGEAPYGREAGRMGVLNLLTHSGVPVAEGVVLTHDFHRRFIEPAASCAPFKTPRALEEMSGDERWPYDESTVGAP